MRRRVGVKRLGFGGAFGNHGNRFPSAADPFPAWLTRAAVEPSPARCVVGVEVVGVEVEVVEAFVCVLALADGVPV